MWKRLLHGLVNATTSRVLSKWFEKSKKVSQHVQSSPSTSNFIWFFYIAEEKLHLDASVCTCIYMYISILYKTTGIKICSAKVGLQFGSMWKDCAKFMVCREQNSA